MPGGMEGSLPGEVPNFTLHNTSPAMMPGEVMFLGTGHEYHSLGNSSSLCVGSENDTKDSQRIRK